MYQCIDNSPRMKPVSLWTSLQSFSFERANEINDKYWARTFYVHLCHLRFMYRIVVLFWYNIQKVFILSNPQEFNNNRQTYIHDIIFCQFIVYWSCLCKKLLMNVPFSITVLCERSSVSLLIICSILLQCQLYLHPRLLFIYDWRGFS